jgi:hypothetical protein
MLSKYLASTGSSQGSNKLPAQLAPMLNIMVLPGFVVSLLQAHRALH